MDLIGKTPKRPAVGLAATVQEPGHRPSGSFKQALNGVGLHLMLRKLPNNLMFVFCEDW